MRKFKFRMWDNLANKYFFDQSQVIECIRQQSIGLFDHVSNGSIFEQFTGLLDKNGVEIYEGDIVDIFDFSICDYIIGRIYFENAAFRICVDDFYHRNVSFEKEIEVVGNINEKPELTP